MPISSSSRRISFLSRGFTLIELLISAAIITIVTSIVLVKFSAFDSTVLLKSTAYDVGMAVREAQIYSVSVVNVLGGDTAFRYPYGLHFDDDGASYIFFRYNDESPFTEPPSYSDGPDGVDPLRTVPLGGSFQVSKICTVGAGVNVCTADEASDIDDMDISFRRPEFGAKFYTSSLAGGQLSDISAVQIYLNSTRDSSNVWIVEVKLLGQISVYLCTSDCS